MTVNDLQIAMLADAFEAAGINSPFSQDPGSRVDGVFYPGPSSYITKGIVVPEEDGWKVPVHDELMRRKRQQFEKKIREKQAQVEHPAIRNYLLSSSLEQRGSPCVEAVDLSYLKVQASIERPYKPAYKPSSSDCPCRLVLKSAIRFRTLQESYADHSFFAIPVVVNEGFNYSNCVARLHQFFHACRSTNGMAGYGSTYECDLVAVDKDCIVVLNQRSSIAD